MTGISAVFINSKAEGVKPANGQKVTSSGFAGGGGAGGIFRKVNVLPRGRGGIPTGVH